MFGEIETDFEVLNTFEFVERKILDQTEWGLRSMAQAVVDSAKGSLIHHGNKPGDKGYKAAPHGEPPYSHTYTLRNSLTYAYRGDELIVGTKFSEVGLRSAWFEFGGRENEEKDTEGKPGKLVKIGGKWRRIKQKRRWKPHPFIGPALDRELDTFAPRVSGTWLVTM